MKVAFPRTDHALVDALLADAETQGQRWGVPLECCLWCGCTWHGLTCFQCIRCGYTTNSTARGPCEHLGVQCLCDGSAIRLDDTWRPRMNLVAWQGQQLVTMRDTGVDGWAARAVISSLAHPSDVRRLRRLRRLLYGRS